MLLTNLVSCQSVSGMDYITQYTDTNDNLYDYLPFDRMDEIWHGEFAKVFSPFLPHIWYLVPTPGSPSPRWKRFKDSAKVRFCCQTCGHGWTSMKGRVVFWYFLNYPYYEGFVHFKLYGQQCQRCNNGMYETAMWYPEEVNKVLCNLYNRIGQAYYGFVKPPMRYDRRAGKPRTQHNAALCQACQDGECDSRPRTTTNPVASGVVSTTGGGTTTPQAPPPPPPPPTTTVIQTTPPPKTTTIRA
ncbi:receptor-transporting protein 3-like isoform X2 [Antedon mediterranea]|uniref:receptor-transporting protein 3-like isoform X2 n=1 Tax=Antedon mediterranea TaxID=105859 RepID=UPI003AF8A1EF